MVIAFDYSGTLSPGAAAFGQRDALDRALADSGLAALGVDAATYWQRIVTPTWPAASTTRRPFARYIADVLGEQASGAAGRFVTAYLGASQIAPPWRPLLEALCRRRDVQVLAATDHYAEATGAIIRHLAAMGLAALPLMDAPPSGAGIRVANSADLGCHKSDPDFWRQVVRGLGPAHAVMLVDDFGAGEAPDAGDASAGAVGQRQRRTVAALKAAGGWSVRVHAVPPAGAAPWAEVVETAWNRVRRCLDDA
jgi:FMN phosphatase YigB (HAD superfamily)